MRGAAASALAVLTPTSSAPIRPGPRVTASASTSSSSTPASASAASTTGLTSSRWWREATSGTTPPKRACAAACEEITLERIAAPSTTAAQVSSQEVSIARINASLASRLGDAELEPHDQGVLAVVVVVAAAVAGGAEAEALVHRDRRAVGDPDLEREAGVGARPPRTGARISSVAMPCAAALGGDGDVHQVPDVGVARADQVADAARRRRRRARQMPDGLESSSTNIASDQGVGNERRSIASTAGRSL